MRDTGSITAELLSRPHQVFFYFLRMVFPSPVGTLRWTNYSNKTDVFTANIDGTTEDWDCSPVWEPGTLEQSDQTIVTVNDISIGNADNVFGLLVKKHNWKSVAVDIYVAWFDDVTLELVDVIKIFRGTGDRAEAGDVVSASLLPGKPVLAMKFPRRTFTRAHGFKFLAPPNFKFPWGQQQITAPPAPQVNVSGNYPPAPPFWSVPLDLGNNGSAQNNGDLTQPTHPPPRVVPPRGAL